MVSVNKRGIALMLVVAGWTAQASLSADPATPTAATAAAATPTAAAPAAPTPQETALKARLDPLQTQLTAAVTAKNYDNYKSALNKLTTPDCKFYDVSGQSATKSQFLDVERQALAAQSQGQTETMQSLTLNVTGPTALETAVVTDDKDAVDATGQYGAKGKTHHWERQTSLRLHLSKVATGSDKNDWKATEIAVTDVRTLLDGHLYVQSQPKTKSHSSTKKSTNNTNRNRTQQRYYSVPKIKRAHVRRTPYIIPGGRIY